jgi:hypothetical protein
MKGKQHETHFHLYCRCSPLGRCLRPGEPQGHRNGLERDRDRGKVTIKHGPVASLNWPGMNMAFGVKDKALLDKVKPGQKIEFSFVEQGRDYVVTEVK